MAPPKQQIRGPLNLRSASPEETIELAESFAPLCRANDVICLQGTLGAGKTHFVKGLAKGLDAASPSEVTSPTFVLLKEYPGRLRLYHFDAYRLKHADEMEEIGCEEVFGSGGVSVIEWADHVPQCLPKEHFLVTIRVKGPVRRDILFGAVGAKAPARMGKIAEALRPWLVVDK